ncbi:MAG: hypothetical protein ABIJ09_00075 [Pseudomonadota bacterium]
MTRLVATALLCGWSLGCPNRGSVIDAAQLDAGSHDASTAGDGATADVGARDADVARDSAALGDAPTGTDAASTRDAGAWDSSRRTDGTVAPACIALTTSTASGASALPMPGGSEPGAGTPFTIATSGVVVQRLTDGADASQFSSAYTNGYSRWSPSSLGGEYVTAFAGNGGAAVYRLSDRSVMRTLSIGEPNELHWDSSGAHGTATTIYYRTGAELRRMDVLTGSDALVHDFGVEFPGAGAAINGVEGAPSRDMRTWAFQICDSMSGGGQCQGLRDVVVYDLPSDQITARLGDVHPGFPTPNFVDVSPSGSRIVVGSCAGNPEPFNGMYAWSPDFSQRVRLSTGCTHSGWAWGLNGEEIFVSQDPCGANNDEITFTCDHFAAVDVNDAQGWEHRIAALAFDDLGWGNGIHIGRIDDSRVRGWFFVSTYSTGTSNWGTDQLFFVELVASSANPRIWQVTPTLNDYQDYWSEAFASLDFQAQHIYWGANWGGTAELQLYQAQLCAGWWDVLNEN